MDFPTYNNSSYSRIHGIERVNYKDDLIHKIKNDYLFYFKEYGKKSK